jgi:hypothetical protein
MTALRKPKTDLQTRSSHRTYRDPNPTDVAICRQVNSDDDLVRLAVGVDRVELRQAPGGGWIPEVMTGAIVQALRSIDLVGGSADPRAERLEREMRRRLADALARIRVRCNRRLLAGVTSIVTADTEQRVLVLAFAGRDVASCEWHLAISD